MSLLITAFIIIGLLLLTIAVVPLILKLTNKIQFHPEIYELEEWHINGILGIFITLGIVFIGSAIYMGIVSTTTPKIKESQTKKYSHKQTWSGPIKGLPGLSGISGTPELRRTPKPTNYQPIFAKPSRSPGSIRKSSEYADMSRLSSHFAESDRHIYGPFPQDDTYGTIPKRNREYGHLYTDEDLEYQQKGYGFLPA